MKPKDAPSVSGRQGIDSAITFVNRTDYQIELFWRTTTGDRRSYGKVEPGKEKRQHTFEDHVWEVVDSKSRTLAVYRASKVHEHAIVTGKVGDYVNRRRLKRTRSNRSPDGRWIFSVRDQNIFIRPAENAGGLETQLTFDGDPQNAYGVLTWSPDSKRIVALQTRPGDNREVSLIESSPKGGGPAILHRHRYTLPGDKMSSHQIVMIEVDSQRLVRPKVDAIDFGRPRLRWGSDGKAFTYEKVDRGHQRFRLMEINAVSGAARSIVDERSDTFIWTSHAGSAIRPVHYIADREEALYLSECDGWRHLYLVDLNKGEIANQITRGEFVVRGIDQIDAEARQVWFHACGMNKDQDPYLMHYYRIDFDGSNLVHLTEEDGYHEIEFSPDRRFYIDKYSRVDRPPVNELRRSDDGMKVCDLEKAACDEQVAQQLPRVFTSKGRDGETDIWGIICLPKDYDPRKKYPIIEDIYAGPHDSFVPKKFSGAQRYQSFTDRGFAVVKIDGMGTANRSKAFHDVCWHNLKDAGFPDRILWIKAAAKEYPGLDIDRVGIYGTSAGGQSSSGALLFHGDFYKVAVSSCGCHDNRMDKASWNEQWMGYPVGPHYAASSNIDNAGRLKGDLMLIVGELDRNVPPESTLRFADALIKANKDFELIVLPGVGHSDGGAYGRRRREDFFAEHLLNSK